jgi:hypothetical protein
MGELFDVIGGIATGPDPLKSDALRWLALPLGLPFVYTNSHGEARQNCTQKEDGAPTGDEVQRDDPREA